jgi:hypothetical protein
VVSAARAAIAAKAVQVDRFTPRLSARPAKKPHLFPDHCPDLAVSGRMN